MVEELTKFTGYSPILKIEFFTNNEFSPQNTTNKSTEGKETGKEESKEEVEYYYDSKTSLTN
jgi:hypothetical protein